ncbi:hypothetical protein WMY93_019374 [Mugilogobius chulae]|uniref:BED-type domain-containing protein n=1 Tax=Mugilogobius chulae TaxID=88201 RepID=A0AAW0NKY7_9GOBI
MAAAVAESDLVPKKNSTSIIWNWFGFAPDDEEQKKIICKVCKETVKATDGNTTNLFGHLKRKHKKQYSESQAAQAAKAKTSAPAAASAPKQQMLTDAFAKLTPYVRDGQRWNAITDAVAFHIVKDMCPLQTVEGVGFKKMVRVLDPRYELPSRKFFSNTVIPRMYTDCRSKVSAQIGKVQFFATTSDLWSSRTSEPYLSLTIHFIDNWKLCNATLQTTYFPEDHTGELIAAGLREALESWNLENQNMTCMTTDSGANMVKALDLNQWTRLQCFGHRLHLAIEKSAKDPRIERVTSVCKKVVSTFSFSWKKKRDLITAQAHHNLPQHKMITESPTRWGSKLAMIERILEQEKAISEVLKADKKTKHLALSWQDLDVMDSLKKALGPLRDFTDALSGEDYVSVSYVKPVLHLLRNNLLKTEDDDTELTAKIKSTVNDYLTEKYKDPANDALLDMASLVDPRFKTQYIDADKKGHIEERAVTELESLLSPQPDPVSSSSTSQNVLDTNPPKKVKRSLGSFLKDVAAAAPTTSLEPEPTTMRELIQRELHSYLALPVVDSEMNPLEWWKIHEVNFPKVSQLAQKYLCIPATSAPSERVFSTGGNIVTCQRAALKPDKVDKLIFLAKNL